MMTMTQPYTPDELKRGEQIVQELHGIKGFDAWAEHIARELANARARVMDFYGQSMDQAAADNFGLTADDRGNENSDELCPVPPAKNEAVSTQTACELKGEATDSPLARRMPDSESIGSLAHGTGTTQCEDRASPSPSEAKQEPDDAENTAIGGITWHSSEEDGGPDVGISVYLGKDERLWLGEISRKAFDDNNGGAHFDSDGGWFILRFQGDETKLIAKCGDELEAREFIEQISAWLTGRPSQAIDRAGIEPQPTPEMISDLVAGLKYVAEFPVNNSQRQHAQQVLGRFAFALAGKP